MLSALVSLAAIAALATAQTMEGLANSAKSFPPGPDAKSPLLKITTPPGPYKVSIREDAHFPNRTLYIPENANETLPVFAWENGICYKYGRMYAGYLTEIAAKGYFVIAPGKPTILDKGMTNADWQMQSIEMARSFQPTGFKINARKVGVAGHSCGGSETLRNLASDDEDRITTGIILNSGGASTQYDEVKAPILLIHGGQKDVGRVADSNFEYIQENRQDLPVFKAVLETGHLGSFFSQPRGGIYAETTVRWLDWQLKGRPMAAAWFKGGAQSEAAKRGWKTESNAIDDVDLQKKNTAKSGVVGLAF